MLESSTIGIRAALVAAGTTASDLAIDTMDTSGFLLVQPAARCTVDGEVRPLEKYPHTHICSNTIKGTSLFSFPYPTENVGGGNYGIFNKIGAMISTAYSGLIGAIDGDESLRFKYERILRAERA